MENITTASYDFGLYLLSQVRTQVLEVVACYQSGTGAGA